MAIVIYFEVDVRDVLGYDYFCDFLEVDLYCNVLGYGLEGGTYIGRLIRLIAQRTRCVYDYYDVIGRVYDDVLFTLYCG